MRDIEAAGREEEIEQISRAISEVAPELPGLSVKECLEMPLGWFRT